MINLKAIDPYYHIETEEFEDGLKKFFAFCETVTNKPSKPVNIFSLIITDQLYMDILKNMLQMENDKKIILQYTSLYPKVCKSKIIKRIIFKE